MTLPIRWPALIALCLLACGASVVHAQTSFGSRSFGNGISANAAGGSSNFGQGYNSGGAGLGGSGYGTGGSSYGSSLPTSYGLSSSTGGGNGTTGATGIAGAQASAGQVTSNARYLPENRQGAFVGADRGDSSAFFSQQQGMQNQSMQSQNAFFSQLSQQMQRNANQLQQQNRNGGRNQQQLRVSLKLGFEPRGAVVTNVTTAKLEKRFTRLPGLQPVTPVQVFVDGDTVILRGQVATESDRELAEGIALLEPGISAVRNELVVGPADSTAAE